MTMFFRQYYLSCLSHASYLIGDTTTGRAVVVDPQRDIAGYLLDAADNDLRIERVIETHFHADFLTGHLELQQATGAVISYGDAARGMTEFPIELLGHMSRLSLGEVQLEIRHTSGHTPESICIVVYEHPKDETPYGVLTGDTLFIGDVGRPDLLSSVGVSADTLARHLYRSTREQLLTLPDETRIFPSHGAGSACGKKLSEETQSTIGVQRVTNYALAPMSEDDFVSAVTEGLTAAPLYFTFATQQNRRDREKLVEDSPLAELGFEDVISRQKGGAVLLDVRDQTTFAQGHIEHSLNVGLTGRFAEYVGAMVSPTTDIVLIVEPDTEVEARNRLARIGFDRVVGFLHDPIRALTLHPEVARIAPRVDASTLANVISGGINPQIVDVRGETETESGVVPGSILVPLIELTRRVTELSAHRPTVVYCAGGYRSMIAASYLRAQGFTDVSDLIGGYAAWIA